MGHWNVDTSDHTHIDSRVSIEVAQFACLSAWFSTEPELFLCDDVLMSQIFLYQDVSGEGAWHCLVAQVINTHALPPAVHWGTSAKEALPAMLKKLHLA